MPARVWLCVWMRVRVGGLDEGEGGGVCVCGLGV